MLLDIGRVARPATRRRILCAVTGRNETGSSACPADQIRMPDKAKSSNAC
jgi:hypothetical protein